jgi:3'(2'), 5'-bisphosphate nucleotidase
MRRHDLDILASIARDAGQGILSSYERDFRVEYKGPGDPVTDADRDANALICSRLQAAFPDAAIVAEESDAEHYAGYRQQSRVFFVDPLDGTREYVARNGQFVVMIGLLIDDVASVGVIYAPTTDTLWCGARGIGAFCVESDGSERPILISRVGEPEASRITVTRTHSEALSQALSRVAPREVVPMGSAGLKGALVADGSLDAYLALGFSGMYWDGCAMDALVGAAGGTMTDLSGRPIDYRSHRFDLSNGVLAANPDLHAALLRRLA